MNKNIAGAAAVLLGATLLLAAGCAGMDSNGGNGQSASAEPTIGAKHILVTYQGSESASVDVTRTKAEAQALINDLLERAKQGEKLEDLAIDYSDCPSARNGGDLGEFGKGQMVPAFEEAAFACEVGGLTDVVETPFGYHVIQRYK